VKNLFQFQDSSSCGGGAPKLVPSSGGILESLSNNFLKNDSVSYGTNGMIDVINGFYWTSSQLSSRQDVPAIVLKEKKLKQNSLISQLAYYSRIVSSQGGQASGRLANLFSNSKIGSGPIGGFLGNTVGRAITGFGRRLVGAASNFGSGVMGSGLLQLFTGKSAEGIIDAMTGDKASSDVLLPYEGLYITEDTKFVYRMPYFENIAHAVQNSFASDDKNISGSIGLGGMLAGAIGKIEKGVYGLASSMNIQEPGIYIEKPQFYAFGASGDVVRFSFPLINTGWATFEDVQKKLATDISSRLSKQTK
jgi:hypothetical protein